MIFQLKKKHWTHRFSDLAARNLFLSGFPCCRLFDATVVTGTASMVAAAVLAINFAFRPVSTWAAFMSVVPLQSILLRRCCDLTFLAPLPVKQQHGLLTSDFVFKIKQNSFEIIRFCKCYA